MGEWKGLALASNRPICALGKHEKINNRKEGGATWGFLFVEASFSNRRAKISQNIWDAGT